MPNYARDTAAPRPMVLGGRSLFISKLTPRGIGDLQAWFASVLQSPYAAAREAIAGLPEDEARTRWIAAVSEARDTWPPTLESEIGHTLLTSPEGRGLLVWVAARQHTPGLTRSEADAIGSLLTADEFTALFAALAPGEIGDIRNPDAQGDGLPYSEIRAQLCKQYPGWTFDRVDNMTFEQIADAWREGKPARAVEVADPSEAVAMVARWREFYVGL